MLKHAQSPTFRFTGSALTRQFDVWLLCSLLLFLATSTGLVSYEIHKHTLRPATSQAYIVSEQIRREFSKAIPLVLWWASILAIAVVIEARVLLLPAVAPATLSFKGFDPESHLRPPPR